MLKLNFIQFFPLVIAGHVVEKVCKPFGIAPPIFPRRVDWFRQVRAFSIDKAKHELGYKPKVDMTKGLKILQYGMKKWATLVRMPKIYLS